LLGSCFEDLQLKLNAAWASRNLELLRGSSLPHFPVLLIWQARQAKATKSRHSLLYAMELQLYVQAMLEDLTTWDKNLTDCTPIWSIDRQNSRIFPSYIR
jgi:hypothetical protein